MAVNKDLYQQILLEIKAKNVSLVAVSKTKPAEDILSLYKCGQKDFGENYVKELIDKYAELPKDIRWHFIGHLQTNKVKFIAPFVSLIQTVDSLKLLKEINKHAHNNNRIIDCLLQIHIASEETKFGLNEQELNLIIEQFDSSTMKNINIIGLMGMASFINDEKKIRSEFAYLNSLFSKYKTSLKNNISLSVLSMGMSNDYNIAIQEGSTMVRIGSLLFGAR